MHIFTLFFVGSMVLLTQAPRTVQQVLGKDKVQSILKAAAAESVARLSDTYLLTDEGIEALKKAGVSQMVLWQLSGQFIHGKIDVDEEVSLVDKEIEGRENFLRAVRRAIGEEETRRHQDAILIHTQGYLILDQDFEEKITAQVLNTEAPAKGVSKWLNRNFRVFLSGYVSFLTTKSPIKNRLTSHEEWIDEFLKIQRAKCGMLECPGVPPCCGKLCDPCKTGNLLSR